MSKSASQRNRRPRTQFAVEALEERALLSGNVISGFVYQDTNNNGLFDAGEAPIANSVVELHNASGTIIATATTDAAGFYKFDRDNTVDRSTKSLTKTVTFDATETDFVLQGLLDQFDPSLGELQSIEITHDASITSEIKVENMSPVSGSEIAGTVSGVITLTAPGVNDKLSLSKYVGSFTANKFDGQSDYTGSSGQSFGIKTAPGSNVITLTGAAMAPYLGTGKVTVTSSAVATSNASGGGNLLVNVQSTAKSTVTVVYKYVLSNSIKPGSYVLKQNPQPAGFFDGKESSAGNVLPNSTGTDTIPVTLASGDSTHNDFGELKATSLAGHVYVDANDNGIMDAGEKGIANATVKLTGFSDQGPVNLMATTDASGAYAFTNLRPGTYALTETQPANYADGQDRAGSLGGSVSNDTITNIVVNAGADGVHYDFGEIEPAKLSGYVYVDANDDGLRGPGERAVAGAKLTLSGTDYHGNAVNLSTTTDASGFYQFAALLPGTYVITETQPAGYDDGKDTAGTLGGVAGNDVISDIVLVMGANGEFYNFGEKVKAYADLSIAKTVSAPIVKVADTFTYTITVKNHGDFTAQNVKVVDVLPSQVSIVDIQAPGWTSSYSNGVVTATLPSLAVGQTASFKILVKAPNAPATVNNPADVSSDTADTNPDNNHSEASTNIVADPDVLTAKSIPPLVTSLGSPTIIGKAQLFNDSVITAGPSQSRSLSAFVDGTYKTLTGAAASPAAMQQAVNALKAGQSRQAFVQSVWNSNAHYAYQARGVYQGLLNRAPTGAELASAISTLKSGSDLALTAQVASSDEYLQKHAGSNSLAQGLSEDLLGIKPGSVSKLALMQSMDQQPVSSVVQSMLNSDGARRNQVDDLYRQILRRVPSTAEVNYWASKLADGSTTTTQLSLQLLASNEFFQLTYRRAR